MPTLPQVHGFLYNLHIKPPRVDKPHCFTKLYLQKYYIAERSRSQISAASIPVIIHCVCQYIVLTLQGPVPRTNFYRVILITFLSKMWNLFNSGTRSDVKKKTYSGSGFTQQSYPDYSVNLLLGN